MELGSSAMVRPLMLVLPLEVTVASGPSSALAEAVAVNDEVSTSSIKPASLGTVAVEARTGMLNRRNAVAVAAATAAIGREVEVESGPMGMGKGPMGIGMGVVVEAAEVAISVSDEFSRFGPAT